MSIRQKSKRDRKLIKYVISMITLIVRVLSLTSFKQDKLSLLTYIAAHDEYCSSYRDSTTVSNIYPLSVIPPPSSAKLIPRVSPFSARFIIKAGRATRRRPLHCNQIKI